jgi:uncharacterized protein (TIGR00255 family)
MTGFGEGTDASSRANITVELRSVNNRYLKISTKIPESHARAEVEIDRLVREKVSRGTVSVTVRLAARAENQAGRINIELVRSYLEQLAPLGADASSLVPSILLLPGVVQESQVREDAEADLPAIERALSLALVGFDEMRLREGASMKEDLSGHCDAIEQLAAVVNQRAPLAATAFRDRLLERVKDLISHHGVSVSPADLIREVSIHAERSDVAEEVARLRSHVAQFRVTMDAAEACGRKLDFLTQEMFRECNTLGSKSADPEISHAALELKSIVERMKEMIANVE